MIGSQLAGLVVPYAQELRDLGVDEGLLRELAELTGGGPLERRRRTPSSEPAARRGFRSDLWPWLVGLVAVALVPEIAMRRVGPALARLAWWRKRG